MKNLPHFLDSLLDNTNNLVSSGGSSSGSTNATVSTAAKARRGGDVIICKLASLGGFQRWLSLVALKGKKRGRSVTQDSAC